MAKTIDILVPTGLFVLFVALYVSTVEQKPVYEFKDPHPAISGDKQHPDYYVVLLRDYAAKHNWQLNYIAGDSLSIRRDANGLRNLYFKMGGRDENSHNVVAREALQYLKYFQYNPSLS